MAYHITLKQGNLLEEPDTTFMVNASNTQLLLGSGVSMSFKRHCGNELQVEMTQCLNSLKEPLQKGDVVPTSSANATNFKYALHAAIMDYNQGTKTSQKKPTLETIKMVLENIQIYLDWYSKEKELTMKLVLPLMGCGVGGLDKKQVLKTYKQFFEQKIPYECEVVVYAYTDDDMHLVKKVLNENIDSYHNKVC